MTDSKARPAPTKKPKVIRWEQRILLAKYRGDLLYLVANRRGTEMSARDAIEHIRIDLHRGDKPGPPETFPCVDGLRVIDNLAEVTQTLNQYFEERLDDIRHAAGFEEDPQ